MRTQDAGDGPGSAVVVDGAPDELPAAAAPWQSAVGAIAVVAVVVSGLNYAFSLVAARLLPAAGFASYAAVQSVLLVLGTGTLAASPWAVARYLARNDGPDVLAEGFYFGMAAAAVQALVFGPVVGLLCWNIGGPAVGVAGGLAGAGIAMLAGPSGYIQGRGLVLPLALVRLLETLVRVLVSVLLVLGVGRTAVWAITGFPVGSAVALVAALVLCREAMPGKRPSGAVVRALLRQSAGSGGIQIALVMLGALDSVYVNGGRFEIGSIASYQAAALIGRVPIFVSTAISLSSYTTIAAAPGPVAVAAEIRHAVRLFAAFSVPFVVVCWTVPHQVLSVVIPDRYSEAGPLLRYVAISGVMVGLIDMLTTAHQARARYRACLVVTGVAVVVQGVLLVGAGRTGSITTFAVAFDLLATTTAAVLLVTLYVDLRQPRGGRAARPVPLPAARRRAVVAAVGGGACVVAAALLHHSLLWLLPAAGVFVAGAALAFAPTPEPAHAVFVPQSRSADDRPPLTEGSR